VKGAPALLIALSLALGLSACGGGGSSTASTTAGGPPPAATGASTPTRPPAKPTASKSSPSRRFSAYAAARRDAGGGAGFVERGGDNSIPDYGSESSGSQKTEATAALRAFLAARAGGDWSVACSYLAARIYKQLEALVGAAGSKVKGCAGSYAMLGSRIPAAQRANPLRGALAAMRVNGENAFALFYGPHHQKYMMPMVHEGGAWKAGQLDPVPYPPGAPSAGG